MALVVWLCNWKELSPREACVRTLCRLPAADLPQLTVTVRFTACSKDVPVSSRFYLLCMQALKWSEQFEKSEGSLEDYNKKGVNKRP